MVHQGLKRGGCIGQSKRHDHKLVMVFMGAESRHIDIGHMNSYLMVG